MTTFAQLVEKLEGTYVGVRFDKRSTDMLQQLQKMLKLKNPTPVESMHSTVAYSRNKIEFPVNPSVGVDIDGTVGFHIFKTSKGENALVLLLDSSYLRERHELANSLGATYDFPDYRPHITLSYDVGDKKFPMKKFKLDQPLTIESEYSEVLDLDWKPKKS